MPTKITGPNDPRVQAFAGKKFGRLQLLHFNGMSDGRQKWFCRCDCGVELVRDLHLVSTGHTASCGCLAREAIVSRNLIHGHSVRGRPTPEFVTWGHMLQRCRNPNCRDYPSYGGRGITVCERWLKFQNFFQDMGKRPHGLTLERKDNEGGYSPDNCCWATQSDQNRNQRRRMVFFAHCL